MVLQPQAVVPGAQVPHSHSVISRAGCQGFDTTFWRWHKGDARHRVAVPPQRPDAAVAAAAATAHVPQLDAQIVAA